MRILSTVPALVLVLSAMSLPALAQDVFVRSNNTAPAAEEGVPSAPPPAPDSGFLPFASTAPTGMGTAAPAAQDSPMLSSSQPQSGVPTMAPSSPIAGGTDKLSGAATARFTPEQYKKAELQMKQLAQQYPEMRVNGFTIAKDIEQLGKYQLQMSQKMQQACSLPSTPQILIDPFGFFKIPKATENFPKVGMLFITQVLSQACTDSAQKQALAERNPIIQVRNIPGTKTPGFSTDGGLIYYDDDFTNADSPGFAATSSQLRRLLTTIAEESQKLNDPPNVDGKEMQKRLEEYEKNQSKSR